MPKYKKHTSGEHLHIYKSESSPIPLPFANEGVSAGFPSPAQDYIELSIDLNKELIKNQASTFLVRVDGFSMIDDCIFDGDILVVDKSITPKNDDIVVSFIDGEFTLKRLRIEKDAIFLMPANPKYKPIKITEENNFVVWGVVTYSIQNQKLKHKHH